MTSWKQPIDTSYRTLFGQDVTTKFVWIEILLRARSQDNQDPERVGREIHYLKKGQCVLGYEELAACVGSNKKAVMKSVKILKEKYDLLDYVGTPNGTVVTVKSFDNVVGMGQRDTQRKDNEGTLTRVKDIKIKDIREEVVDKSTTVPKNARVELVLKTYKANLDIGPEDRQPRYEAYNLVRAIEKLMKHENNPNTDEVFLDWLNRAMGKLKQQDKFFPEIRTLATLRRKVKSLVDRRIETSQQDLPKIINSTNI